MTLNLRNFLSSISLYIINAHITASFFSKLEVITEMYEALSYIPYVSEIRSKTMKTHYKIPRTVLAAGSVMDIWPTGDYSQHMPKGTAQDRIGQHWANAGSHLYKAVSDYQKRVQHAGSTR